MSDAAVHVEQFIEQLGSLAEGDGLPRTAGRMMGLLIVSGSPLGIDDLAARLKVSRASVSTNSRLLQSLAIAQLVRAPGDRRDYLQIRGDSSSSLLTLGLHRMEAMRVVIREMRLALSAGPQSAPTRTRLQQMERTYDAAIEQLHSVLGESFARGEGAKSIIAARQPLALRQPPALRSTRRAGTARKAARRRSAASGSRK